MHVIYTMQLYWRVTCIQPYKACCVTELELHITGETATIG